MFDFKFKHCNEIYHVDEAHIGKNFRCTKCNNINTITKTSDKDQTIRSITSIHVHDNEAGSTCPSPYSRYTNKNMLKRNIAIFISIFFIITLFISIVVPNHKTFNSLANGTHIIVGGSSGHGELLVSNGTRDDAIIKLVMENRVKRFVYIKKQSKVAIYGIDPGTYQVIFSTGLDWDNNKQGFNKPSSFLKFDDPFVFKETETECTEYSITLHPVQQGTATTSNIDPCEFFSYQ